MRLTKKQAAALNAAREAAMDATHASALATYGKLIAAAKEYSDAISAPCNGGYKFPEDGDPEWDAAESAFGKLVAARAAYRAAFEARAEATLNFDVETAYESGKSVAEAVEVGISAYAALEAAAERALAETSTK